MERLGTVPSERIYCFAHHPVILQQFVGCFRGHGVYSNFYVISGSPLEKGSARGACLRPGRATCEKDNRYRIRRPRGREGICAPSVTAKSTRLDAAPVVG